ncbi:MAG: hypothetical protein HY902_05555 [Deltaproteobacteria bacterium]|nr:hypothetical protein [Deltaproteobacteria bacterium]
MPNLPIPPLGHVVWLAGRLPDLAWLAVKMALDVGQLPRVVLWSLPGQLRRDRRVEALLDTGKVELGDLSEPGDDQLDAATGAGTRARLLRLDSILQLPAARADLARLRLLWGHGGLYLDADALTLANLDLLRVHPGFCGLERVALPADLYQSKNPLRWAKAGALLAARHAVAQSAGAGERFAKLEQHFALACNNAVLGARPRHPFVAELLRRIAAMDDSRAQRLYELGPRLLEAATGNASGPDWQVLPPEVCYPLAPEVCADYIHADPQQKLGATPHPRAVVAHLYDSVLARRIGKRPDLAWLGAHRHTTLLGRMTAPWLDELANYE